MPYYNPSIVGTPENIEQPGAPTISHTATQTPTPGNTIVALVRTNNTNSTTVSSSGWSKIAESGGTLTPSWAVFTRKVVDVAGAPDITGVTFTLSSTPGNTDISWLEVNRLGTTLDQAAGTPTTGTGTSTTPGGQTPGENSMTIALAALSGAVTAPGMTQGFTLLAAGAGSSARWLIGYEMNAAGAASGSPVISWTTSRTFRAVVVTIRGALYGAPPLQREAPHRRLLQRR